MKLKAAQVTKFRSIDDSGEVEIDPEVTCLVGKNESGKTAFVSALGRVKPVPGQRTKFDYGLEYPRKDLNTYKRRHKEKPDVAVKLTFELVADEVASIESVYGEGTVHTTTFTVEQGYDNQRTFSSPLSTERVLTHLVDEAELPAEADKELRDKSYVYALHRRAKEIVADVPQAQSIIDTIEGWRDQNLAKAIIDSHLSPLMPEFFYFDDYSIMEGRIAVPDLKRKVAAGETTEAERTFVALLDLVGADLEEFETQDGSERLIASLEAAGNEISDELFEFWSQNKDLEVRFAISGPDAAAGAPYNEGPNLQIRVYNGRHRVTVPFDQRSRGFVWFFSFLAYFSQLERAKDRDLILLLDEPGLNLHATAQGDFLRFINERLALKHQVIYTTHSPFMVEADRLDRVRTVEDRDKVGTKVSSDVLTTSRDTVFPLQAALGYSLAQTLFVGTDNLLVEGPSDLLYLRAFGERLRQLKRTSLDERWVIVPVGGLEKVPTFLALLNTQLNVAAVIDGSAGGLQRLQSLVAKRVVEARQIIPVTEITQTASADMEDLIDVPLYLQLLKGSGVGSIAKTKLAPGDRVVERVKAALGTGFDHYRPANYLVRHPELLEKAEDETLDRFEALFETINQRL